LTLAKLSSPKGGISLKKSSSSIASILAPIVMFFILFGLWQLITIVFNIPRWILPGPIEIFKEMFGNFGEFLPHVWVSIRTIGTGFLIAVPCGIILGGLITNFKVLDSTLSPYIIFLVTTPLITLVPLLMLWFGFGIGVKILAVIIQSFPIVNMNSATGFNNIEAIRLELMQSLSANRVQTFFRAILPSALPDVFTGMKLAGIFATTACISAEYVGGNVGLGSQIIKYSQFMRTESAFSCIFFVAVIGVALYGLISLMEKLVIRWKI